MDIQTGDVWLGTMGAGLARYSGGHFTTWDQMNSGLAGNIVLDVHVADGLIWEATNGGLSSYDPFADRWTLYNARTAKMPQQIFTNLDSCAGKLRALAFEGKQFEFDAALQTFVPGGKKSECAPKPSFAAECIPLLKANDRTPQPEARGRPTIAIYGPRNRTISIPGATSSTSVEPGRPQLAAVEQAIEGANRAGGYRGDSFELTIVQPGYANYAWGLPEDDLVFFEQRPEVLAIIGFLAGDDYITQAVLSHMDLPWMNVAPAELGGNSLADISVFQCWRDQPRQHRAVFDYALQRSGAQQAAFIAGSERDSDRYIHWWKDHAYHRKVHAAADCKLMEDQAENRQHVSHLRLEDIGVVFLWADCDTSLTAIEAIRARSEAILIIAGPQIAENCAPAEVDLRNVIAFLPSHDLAAPPLESRGEIARKSTISESGDAARTWHAAQHLLAAIGDSAKSREAVRRKLAAMSHSAYGEEHFEKLHPPAAVNIAEFRDGQWRVSTFRGG